MSMSDIIRDFMESLEKKGVMNSGWYVDARPLTVDGENFILTYSNGSIDFDSDIVKTAAVSGDIELHFRAQFDIGEFALSDKVLDPEAEKEKREFLKIVPLEHEIAIEEILRELNDDNDI